MWRIVVNAIAFNVGWLACVLTSRWDVPLMAIPMVGVVVGLHVMRTERGERRREVASMMAIAAVGTLVDTGMLASGVLLFQGSSNVTPIFVLWIGAFWINFATLPNVSLRWLRRRLWLASILGAVSAPGTYLAGARLGALEIGEPIWRSMVALGVEWAILLPIVMVVARRVGPSGEARGRAPEATTHAGSAPARRPAS